MYGSFELITLYCKVRLRIWFSCSDVGLVGDICGTVECRYMYQASLLWYLLTISENKVALNSEGNVLKGASL